MKRILSVTLSLILICCFSVTAFATKIQQVPLLDKMQEIMEENSVITGDTNAATDDTIIEEKTETNDVFIPYEPVTEQEEEKMKEEPEYKDELHVRITSYTKTEYINVEYTYEVDTSYDNEEHSHLEEIRKHISDLGYKTEVSDSTISFYKIYQDKTTFNKLFRFDLTGVNNVLTEIKHFATKGLISKHEFEISTYEEGDCDTYVSIELPSEFKSSLKNNKEELMNGEEILLLPENNIEAVGSKVSVLKVIVTLMVIVAFGMIIIVFKKYGTQIAEARRK